MADMQELEWGFEYVSSNPRYSCRVIYDKKKDCIYTQSDMLGESDVPEDLDWDHCVEIPHKNELDLGQRLAFAFVEERLPDEYDRVRSFFVKAGAYARFKDLLEQHDLLKEWHEFENSATQRAFKEWCRENGIDV